MKATKKLSIFGWVFFAIVVFPVLFFILIGPALNDLRTNVIKHQLVSMELPEETEIVESYAYCSNTSGTGNHIEIWAVRLIKTELAPYEINSYFHGLEHYNIAEYGIENYGMPQCEYFKGLKSITDYNCYYIIYKYDKVLTRWDIRKG